MASGKVKVWFPEKGFGFIRPDGDGDDVFFHVSVLRGAGGDAVERGQGVQFELGVDPKTGRTKATRVDLL